MGEELKLAEDVLFYINESGFKIMALITTQYSLTFLQAFLSGRERNGYAVTVSKP